MGGMYNSGLERQAANYVPLSPLTFLERAAAVHPERIAVVHGELRCTWAETYSRCRRLASALRQRGIGAGDTVSVMLPNVPAMYEAHFGVPMSGAVLHSINTRRDADAIAFTLQHAETRAVIADREFSAVMEKAVAQIDSRPLIIDVEDVLYRHPAILEAAVVARPDPKWGESPCAFVALKPGTDATAEEIIEFCREHMAHFKAPRSVIFGPLPKTSTGKIQKYRLRQLASEA